MSLILTILTLGLLTRYQKRKEKKLAKKREKQAAELARAENERKQQEAHLRKLAEEEADFLKAEDLKFSDSRPAYICALLLKAINSPKIKYTLPCSSPYREYFTTEMVFRIIEWNLLGVDPSRHIFEQNDHLRRPLIEKIHMYIRERSGGRGTWSLSRNSRCCGGLEAIILL